MISSAPFTMTLNFSENNEIMTNSDGFKYVNVMPGQNLNLTIIVHDQLQLPAHYTLASLLVHTSTATVEHIMYNSREEGTMIINDTFHTICHTSLLLAVELFVWYRQGATGNGVQDLLTLPHTTPRNQPHHSTVATLDTQQTDWITWRNFFLSNALNSLSPNWMACWSIEPREYFPVNQPTARLLVQVVEPSIEPVVCCVHLAPICASSLTVDWNVSVKCELLERPEPPAHHAEGRVRGCVNQSRVERGLSCHACGCRASC